MWIMQLSLLCFLLPCYTVVAQNRDTSGLDGARPQNYSLEKFFDGLYLGAAAGSQNVFGGSFVGGIDVLAQESRFVAELSAGFRKQLFKGRFLIGAEFQLGFTDGNLKHADPEKQLLITYKNNTQSGVGLTIGAVAGKRRKLLLYGYVNETTRKFDVDILEQNKAYHQKDEQGMLKYGMGIEAPLYKRFHVRFAMGGLRVDFGDLEANINVEDKLDVMAGFVYQFHFKMQNKP